MEVRQAVAEDQPRIYALLRKLLEDRSGPLDDAEDTFSDLLRAHRGTILVAVEDGEVVGTITLSFNLALRYGGEYAQIEELILEESQRGKGTGALLVNTAIAAARERGCREMGLYAMEHTRAFYEKLGFQYTGPELRMDLGR